LRVKSGALVPILMGMVEERLKVVGRR